MRKLDQALESALFLRDNKEKIDAVSDSLKTHILIFVSAASAKTLPCGVLIKVSTFLSQNDFLSVQRLMRSNEFSSACISQRSAWWSIIDAISSFMDALGSHWPYMSQDSRLNRLSHTLQHLEEANLVSM